MVKNVAKRTASLLLVFLLVVSLLPAVTVPAFAASEGEVTGLSNENIGLSYSGDKTDTWSASGTTITGSIQSSIGCGTTHYTSTLTITNNKATTATLSFDYAVTLSGGTIQVDGTAVTANGTFSKDLAAGESIKVYIKSNSTSTATEIDITGIKLVSDVTATATFLPAENGTYTVDGNLIESEYSSTQSSTVAYQVVAAPADGYQFLGWYNVTTGKYINTNATAALNIEADCTITAKFASDGSAVFLVGSQPFDDLNAAAVYAQETGESKVVQVADGTIRAGETYTIPNGVTLLLPYASGATTISTDSDTLHANRAELPNSVRSEELDPMKDLYLTLTIPAETTLNIESGGRLVIGGSISGGNGGSATAAGSTQGAHSNLELNGTVNVRSGGIFSTCGYVLGTGTLNAEAGATVYEPYIVMDHHGGSWMRDAYQSVTPFIRYVVQNIQCDMVIASGAVLNGYCDLYASSDHNPTCVKIVGDTSGGNAILKLSSGAVLTMTYDNSERVVTTGTNTSYVGKGTLSIAGGASYGYLALSISVYGMSAKIDTKSSISPLPYNVDVVLESGNYDINYGFAILPGANITVGNGATLNVGNTTSTTFIVYDGLYDHTATGSPVTYGQAVKDRYPTTDMLKDNGFSAAGGLIVADGGTLNIGANASFGGIVQTNGDSGTITVDSSATLNAQGKIGYVSSSYAGQTVNDLAAEVIDTGTGKRTKLQKGETYHSDASGEDTIPSYTYRLYTKNGTPETHTEPLNEMVHGSFWNTTATVHLVDGSGTILSTREGVKFCIGADVSGYFTDAACTTQAGTIQGNDILYARVVAEVIPQGAASGSYYETLRNALRAAGDADTVKLLADIAADSSNAIGAEKNVTVDLNGKTIAATATPFVNAGALTLDMNGGVISAAAGCTAVENKEGGTLLLHLDGGTISGSSTLVSNYGSAEIDLAGGAIIAQGEGSLHAVTNYGTMSVADSVGTGGNITCENSGYALYCASGSSISKIENVTLSAQNSYAIYNYGGTIETLNSATLLAQNSYAIYNYGGTIGTLNNVTISGKSGILNRNTRSGSQNTTSRYVIASPATIDEITDCSISVTEYGINNYAVINKITGSTTVTASATKAYSVLNQAGWYYDTQIYRATTETDKSAGTITTTYTYDTDNWPTIGEISGNTKITASHASGQYALYNKGVIRKIAGADQGVQIAAKNYALCNFGTVEEISGVAKISAENSDGSKGNYALANALRGSAIEIGRITVQRDVDGDKEYNSDGDTITHTYTYDTPTIKLIGGAESDVQISANSIALYNYGGIGSITDGTSISAANSTAIDNGSSRGQNATCVSERTQKGKDSTTGQYLTMATDTYTCRPATIKAITGNVTISATNSIGVNNGGNIELISNGASLSAKEKALSNTGYYYTLLRQVSGYSGVKAFNIDNSVTKNFDYIASAGTIDKIDGASITAGSSGKAILNGGTIKEICNSTITSSGERAIDNTAAVVTKLTIYTDETHTTEAGFDTYLSYATYDTTQKKYVFSVDGGGKAPERKEQLSIPVIEKLGEGNTISATKNVVISGGRIQEIDGGSTTTIQASSGVGLYNYRGIQTEKTYTNNAEDTSAGIFVPASIGSVSSVAVTAKTYAIQNGDGSTTFGTATIDTLGDGLFASSTGDHAVYNCSGAQLTAISGGVYTGGGSGYALYNENAKAAVPVEGGYFKGGAAARANAIRSADNAAYTAYPQGKALSLLPVTPPKGSSATHYTLDRADYGITVTSCLNGSGQTVADVALSGTGTYSVAKCAAGEKITLAASESAGFRFLGWYKKASGSSYSGTPWQSGLSVTTTLADLLKEVGADADGSIALVAVYEPTSEKLKLTVTGKRFTLNGDAQTDQFTAYYPAGTEITLALSDDSFLYWTNGGDKVVKRSDGSAYTFTLVTPTELTAVYKSDDSAMVRVSFLSESGRVVSSRCYAAGDAVTLPDKQPSKLGYRFTGWDKTAEEIAAAIGSGSAEVLVYPTYTKLAGTYTVKAFNGTEVLSEQAYALGDTASVTAPNVDGQVFRFWASDASGTSILSYRQTYSFRVTRDVEIYAIYGSSAPEAQPLVRVDDILPQENSGVRRLTFMTSANIPENYELVELGVLLSRDASAATQDGMVIEMAGVTGSGIVKAASNLSSAAEPGKSDFSYTVNVRVPAGQEANTVYLRVYAAVRRNDSSEITYYYSDIASASYTNLQQGG